MINPKMLKALNEQINYELFSAYLYLSMATYFEEKALSGFSSWLRLQAKEEISHAMKIFDYIYDANGTVTLTGIKSPEAKWENPLIIFKAAYAHEQKVTRLIHGLVKLADELNDYATREFLQWFVSEQVEEEKSTLEVVQKLEIANENQAALLILDKEMGERGKE